MSTPNSLDRLLEPAEATAIIRAHSAALPTERAPLTDLAERVLMEDVVSDEDQPPFPAATMDGYAVISSDDAPVRQIVGDQFAGTVEGRSRRRRACGLARRRAPGRTSARSAAT